MQSVIIWLEDINACVLQVKGKYLKKVYENNIFLSGYDYWTAEVGCAEVNECTDSKYTPTSS